MLELAKEIAGKIGRTIANPKQTAADFKNSMGILADNTAAALKNVNGPTVAASGLAGAGAGALAGHHAGKKKETEKRETEKTAFWKGFERRSHDRGPF